MRVLKISRSWLFCTVVRVGHRQQQEMADSSRRNCGAVSPLSLGDRWKKNDLLTLNVQVRKLLFFADTQKFLEKAVRHMLLIFPLVFVRPICI